jgi:hypothetical protein
MSRAGGWPSLVVSLSIIVINMQVKCPIANIKQRQELGA